MRVTALMAALVVVVMILVPAGGALQPAQACGTAEPTVPMANDGALVAFLIGGPIGLVVWMVLTPEPTYEPSDAIEPQRGGVEVAL